MNIARRHIFASILFLAAASVAGCANHAPTFFPIGNKNVETGTTLEFEVQAIDDDGDVLEFGIEGKPAAAVFEQIEDHKARFSWTPISSDAGPEGNGMQYNVVFLATDGIDTASEAITIFVTLGGAGTGAPVFITPSDYTLDLDRKQSVSFNIEVRDADSANVTLRAVENIAGGNFQTTTGSKLATFDWTPTEQQVSERPVWSLRVGAKDEANPEVFQDITVLIKGGQQKCEGTPPSIEHAALPDQRGSGDYPVNVTATDAESGISAVALYWMIDTGEGDSFTKTSMSSAGGNSWTGSIPNANLDEGKTADVIYYICATDDDDTSDTKCDLRACVPEDGRYTFTAYAEGNNQCEDDPFEGAEGNDTSGQATMIEFDANNESVLENCKVCPANVDWYRIQIPAGSYWVGALLAYTPANGVLRMDLYDQDGTTLLKAGEVDGNEITVISDVFQQAQTVFLKVEGANAQVENRYTMLALVAEHVPCDADSFESNNTPAEAKTVAEDVYPDLTCCGDPDWYKIELNQGDKLEVEFEFVHADGDLDMWIFDQDTVNNAQTFSCENALACSTTETDDESAVVESMPADGTYYIAMGPYQGAKNTYHMLVAVTPGTQECQDDSDEQNDAPAAAVEADVDVPRTGLVVCPNDEDWYKALMYQDEKIIVDITFLHANGDLDMKLYSPGVTPETLTDHLVATALTSTDNEHIEFDIPENGEYFIRIYGYQLQQGNTYDLTVSYE